MLSCLWLFHYYYLSPGVGAECRRRREAYNGRTCGGAHGSHSLTPSRRRFAHNQNQINDVARTERAQTRRHNFLVGVFSIFVRFVFRLSVRRIRQLRLLSNFNHKISYSLLGCDARSNFAPLSLSLSSALRRSEIDSSFAGRHLASQRKVCSGVTSARSSPMRFGRASSLTLCGSAFHSNLRQMLNSIAEHRRIRSEFFSPSRFSLCVAVAHCL